MQMLLSSSLQHKYSNYLCAYVKVGQQSAAKATATITMATMQSNNQRQAR